MVVVIEERQQLKCQKGIFQCLTEASKCIVKLLEYPKFEYSVVIEDNNTTIYLLTYKERCS